MLKRRLTRITMALCTALSAALATDSFAQGVTTGAVSGFVTDTAGNGIVGAQVEIRNRETGFTVRTISREGDRDYAQSPAHGAPYTVPARRLGFQPLSRDGLIVELGESTKQDLVPAQQTAFLSTDQAPSTMD